MSDSLFDENAHVNNVERFYRKIFCIKFQGEKGDPEKLRIEREEFEKRLREGWIVVH